MIAAALVWMLAAAPVAIRQPAAPPISLVVREAGGMVRLEVVGLSATPYGARYTIEVAGRGPSGTNRTSQSGATTLKPGERATLLSIALGSGGAGQWTATLVVTPTEGAPYRQQQSS
ncbi:MAG: hypothetical protein JWN59_673, partial [Sphingomonas bacterium]|nr:hypothetical protein [Sphingomonas bacterium]